jgi:hypothetical protein
MRKELPECRVWERNRQTRRDIPCSGVAGSGRLIITGWAKGRDIVICALC